MGSYYDLNEADIMTYLIFIYISIAFLLYYMHSSSARSISHMM